MRFFPLAAIVIAVLVLANGKIETPSFALPDLPDARAQSNTPKPGLLVERGEESDRMDPDAGVWRFRPNERVIVHLRRDLRPRYEGKTLIVGCGDRRGDLLVKRSVQVQAHMIVDLGSVARMQRVEHCMLMNKSGRVIARNTSRGVKD